MKTFGEGAPAWLVLLAGTLSLTQTLLIMRLLYVAIIALEKWCGCV